MKTTSILAERRRLARHHARALEKAREGALDASDRVHQALGTARCPPALEMRELCRRAIRELRQVEVAARRAATAERLVNQAMARTAVPTQEAA